MGSRAAPAAAAGRRIGEQLIVTRAPRWNGTGRQNINRAPSPLVARGLPWLTIMLASVLPGWLMIASAPVMPPLAFLVFVAWRQLRPGLLPIWSGLPLGFFDDLFSGEPFGSAVLLWSVVMIVLEIIETRLPWRNFLTEWLVAIGLILAYIVFCLALTDLTGPGTPLQIVVPQIVISVLAYPLIGRFVAVADRFRLRPFMVAR